MKLGFLTVLYADRSLHAVLDRAVELGVDAIELGTGNYPGDAHCRPDEAARAITRARASCAARLPSAAFRSAR